MHFRAMFASLLAVLLLAISCAASDCEASCDLKALGQPCHHEAQAPSRHAMQAHMAGMEYGSMQAGSGLLQSARAVQPASSCYHHVCGEPMTLLNNDERGMVAQLVTGAYTAESAVLLGLPGLRPRSPAPEAPPPRTASLISLQTTLRV